MAVQRTPEAEAEYRAWMNAQSGYIGKEAKAAWWDNWEKAQASKEQMQGYLTNPGQQFNIYGNGEQQQQTAANLSQVGAMTGQNIFQTGQQQQDYYNSLQDRRNGDDAVAANMMAGRNRNVANVGRQFAGRGINGGVAAAGMNTATNTADSEINAQKQQFGRQNDQDLWNYVKRNQKVTGEALAAGSDQGLAASMDTSQAEGVFGTVICTELHRQGYISDEIYAADSEAGKEIAEHLPRVMAGYQFLAAPIVRKMKTSKTFTDKVAFWGVPWAKAMAGEESARAGIIFVVGLPLCYVVSFFLPKEKLAYV